jgi:hypothetical protein
MLLCTSEVMNEQHEIGPGVRLDGVRNVRRKDDRMCGVEAQPLGAGHHGAATVKR